MYKGMTFFAVIPARGGSKGIPKKNIKRFSGKPLIYWTIKAALGSSYIDRIVVSTDDSRIAKISKRYGVEVPFLRPKRLAQDNTPTIDVVLDLLRQLERREKYIPDFVLLLQPTSPLRTSEDINRAVGALISNREADAIAGVTRGSEHPYWMKVINENGFIKDFISGARVFERRQDLPLLYKTNGAIYICKTSVLLKEKTFYPRKTLGYVMPKERSIDIDDILDFKIAEILLK